MTAPSPRMQGVLARIFRESDLIHFINRLITIIQAVNLPHPAIFQKNSLLKPVTTKVECPVIDYECTGDVARHYIVSGLRAKILLDPRNRVPLPLATRNLTMVFAGILIFCCVGEARACLPLLRPACRIQARRIRRSFWCLCTRWR